MAESPQEGTCNSTGKVYLAAVQRTFQKYFGPTPNESLINILCPDCHFLSLFAQVAKCSFQITFPGDSEMGRLLDNGTWTGIVGTVHQNRSQMGVSLITMSPGRLQAVDFSFPYNYDSLRFVTTSRMVSKLQSGSFYLFLPFQLQTWVLVFLLLVFCSAAFLLSRTLQWRTNVRTPSSLSLILDVPLRIVLRQDILCAYRPRRLLVVVLLFLPLLSHFYSALLTTSTSLNFEREDIETLGDLLDAVRKKRVQVVLSPGTNTFTIFQNSESGILADLRRANSEYRHQVYATMSGSIQVVHDQTDKVSFLPEWLSKANILTTGMNPGKFHFLEGHTHSVPRGVIFVKNFSCFEIFNRIVVRSLETGLVENWFTYRQTLFDIRRKHANDRHERFIEVEDVKNTCLLLLFGHLLSFLALLVERCLRCVHGPLRNINVSSQERTNRSYNLRKRKTVYNQINKLVTARRT